MWALQDVGVIYLTPSISCDRAHSKSKSVLRLRRRESVGVGAFIYAMVLLLTGRRLGWKQLLTQLERKRLQKRLDHIRLTRIWLVAGPGIQCSIYPATREKLKNLVLQVGPNVMGMGDASISVPKSKVLHPVPVHATRSHNLSAFKFPSIHDLFSA